jgi:hypothetical protein
MRLIVDALRFLGAPFVLFKNRLIVGGGIPQVRASCVEVMSASLHIARIHSRTASGSVLVRLCTNAVPHLLDVVTRDCMRARSSSTALALICNAPMRPRHTSKNT